MSGSRLSGKARSDLVGVSLPSYTDFSGPISNLRIDSVRLEDIVCDLTITTPTAQAYVLNESTVGVGGFYALLPELRLPVFFSGDVSEYCCFCLNENKVIVAAPQRGVALFDTLTATYKISRAYYNMVKIDNDKLVFAGEVHPSCEAEAERTLVDMASGDLYFVPESVDLRSARRLLSTKLLVYHF